MSQMFRFVSWGLCGNLFSAILVNHFFPSHVCIARILHERRNECVTVVDNSIESQYDENVSRKRSSHVRIN